MTFHEIAAIRNSNAYSESLLKRIESDKLSKALADKFQVSRDAVQALIGADAKHWVRAD